MYMLANGKEVTATDIGDALTQGRAGLINDNGIKLLVLHVIPITFDSIYIVCGKRFLVTKPASKEEALAAAYF